MSLPIIVENVDGVLLDRELHLFPHRHVGWLRPGKKRLFTGHVDLAAGNDRCGAGRCHSVGWCGGVLGVFGVVVLGCLGTPSVLLVLVVLSKNPRKFTARMTGGQ